MSRPSRDLQDLQQMIAKSDAFQLTAKGRQALSIATAMRKMKHGLYARAPLVCKGTKCPSRETCQLLGMGLAPEGERCPIEIAALADVFEGYVKEFGIEPHNIVDLGLVKELAQIEVALDRIADRLASEDMIQEVTIGISETGREIKQPQTHKAIGIWDTLIRRKHEILRLLAATRKDKLENKMDAAFDPATEAAMLVQRKRELEARERELQRREEMIIDVTPSSKDDTESE